MTDKYAELREAVEKATPGPWKSNEYGVGELWVSAPDVNKPGEGWAVCMLDDDVRYAFQEIEQNKFDCNFIAAANPSTIRALLAERDALEAKVEAFCRAVSRGTSNG